MDIEDALKAGHCVDFESGMHSCAKAICSVDGMNMRSDADFMISQLVRTLPESCDPNESFPSAMSDDAGDFSPPSQRIVTWYSTMNSNAPSFSVQYQPDEYIAGVWTSQSVTCSLPARIPKTE